MASHTALHPITSPNTPKNPPWPHGSRAAYTFTLDNMGEAADLNRALWPPSSPIGAHFSVLAILPRILALLDKYDVRATYFIESWNLDVYGAAIRDIANRGHEVAWHAFQHEAWGKMAGRADAERGNYERSFTAVGRFAEQHGTKVRRYRGFRPPGGQVNPGVTLPLAREYGLTYLSPAAEHPAILAEGTANTESGRRGEGGQGLTILPFRWRNIDAYYYMDSFAGLRMIKGEKEAETPIAPKELVRRYKQSLDEVVEQGGWVCTLFHPFLVAGEDEAERLEAIEEVLKYVAGKREKEGLWVARCEDVVEWVNGEGRGSGWEGRDPEWDTSVWR